MRLPAHVMNPNQRLLGERRSRVADVTRARPTRSHSRPRRIASCDCVGDLSITVRELAGTTARRRLAAGSPRRRRLRTRWLLALRSTVDACCVYVPALCGGGG
jgi:hypothetical protein